MFALNVGVILLGWQGIILALSQMHCVGLVFIGTLIHNSVRLAYQIAINATVQN